MAAHVFTFMLDGIGDPIVAQSITRDIRADLGMRSRSDPAAMTLEIESEEPITERDADAVIEIARRYGLEPRDRVGSSFVAGIGVGQLRERVAHEWSSRFATALVFLAPALALSYLAPYLTMESLIIPRGIEAILVGWSMIAVGWPVLYQAILSMRTLRMTPDLFATLLIVPAFAVGIGMIFVDPERARFHITAYALLAMSFQRAAVWRRGPKCAGRAERMAPSATPLLLIALLAAATLPFDPVGAASILLVTPAMIAALSINRLPSMSGAFVYLPLLGLIGAMLLAPRIDDRLAGGRIEAAFLLNVGFTLLLAAATPRRRSENVDEASPVENRRT